jgi:hypothetical protein
LRLRDKDSFGAVGQGTNAAQQLIKDSGLPEIVGSRELPRFADVAALKLVCSKTLTVALIGEKGRVLNPETKAKEIEKVFDVCDDVLVHTSGNSEDLNIESTEKFTVKLPKKEVKQLALSQHAMLVLYGENLVVAWEEQKGETTFPSKNAHFDKLEGTEEMAEITSILALEGCFMMLGKNRTSKKQEVWSFMLVPCTCHGQGDAPIERFWAHCEYDL